jgi:type IV secretion system protein VirB10
VIEDGAAPPSHKQDPDTLVLRGRPRTAVRFRRSVIVGGATFAAAAVAGTAWFALQPPSFRAIGFTSERSDAGPRQPPDELAKAPATYGDVPRLGPPLPGDLGRPILEHRRRMEAQGMDDPGSAPRLKEQARAAELQRLAAEREAAARSPVLAELQSGHPASAGPSSGPGQAIDPAGSEPAGTSPAVQGEQARKRAFLDERDPTGDLNPHAIQDPPSPYVLSAGSIIPASLITGLSSDVPGLVTAQVTQNVFDSPTGKVLLIPQGTRLVGDYDSDVAYGQKRALVAWRRILFPDGSSIRIDGWPAADAGGRSGLADKVDAHGWALLKGVALSSLLGLGTGYSLRSDGAELADALLISAQQGGSKAADSLVAKSLDVQPTITVRPGWPLTVVVREDLALRPWDARRG